MDGKKRSPLQREIEDPGWGGFTRDLKLLPLKDIEKDGYTVEELEDKRGKYYRIIKQVIK